LQGQARPPSAPKLKTKDSLPFLDTDLHGLFEIKLELAFGGFVESFFILWPFVLGDWEWYYQIGGFCTEI